MSKTNTNCWNLRVQVELNQGGREYMEDVTSVQFERGNFEGQTVEYAAFAIFDGHGGKHAAYFARDNLLNKLKQQEGFFSTDPEAVKSAISGAFEATHMAMTKMIDKWPRTPTGHHSTSGTTASVVIIRGNKLYVANVGDSTIVMGSKGADDDKYKHKALTVDHKPNTPKELERIEKCGGCVSARQGVHRVVWKRETFVKTVAKYENGERDGVVKRKSFFEDIPFLAVARSLGDCWSYNKKKDVYVVSPKPDVYVYELKRDTSQFVVIASDGLWGVVTPARAVQIVADCEAENDKLSESSQKDKKSGSAHALVQEALASWRKRKLRADNTSVITVFIDRTRLSQDEFPEQEAYTDHWFSGCGEADEMGEGERRPATPKQILQEEDKALDTRIAEFRKAMGVPEPLFKIKSKNEERKSQETCERQPSKMGTVRRPSSAVKNGDTNEAASKNSDKSTNATATTSKRSNNVEENGRGDGEPARKKACSSTASAGETEKDVGGGHNSQVNDS